MKPVLLQCHQLQEQMDRACAPSPSTTLPVFSSLLSSPLLNSPKDWRKRSSLTGHRPEGLACLCVSLSFRACCRASTSTREAGSLEVYCIHTVASFCVHILQTENVKRGKVPLRWQQCLWAALRGRRHTSMSRNACCHAILSFTLYSLLGSSPGRKNAVNDVVQACVCALQAHPLC